MLPWKLHEYLIPVLPYNFSLKLCNNLSRKYRYFCIDMKKILTLILAIFYMSSSTGATFHMHYCMGKLMDVELWHADDNKCSKCVAGHTKACAKQCCKDEHKTVKLEKDQQKSTESAFHFMQLPAATASFSWCELPQVHPFSLIAAYPFSNAPPRSHKVPAHILHCTFRI